MTQSRDEFAIDIKPGTDKVQLEYFDFAGGLNESSQVDSLRVDELTVARNLILNLDGGVDIREGFSFVTDSAGAYASPPKYLGEYRKQNGTVIRLMTIGTSLMKWDGTVVKAGLQTGDIDGETFNDKFYFLDGAEYYVYDGATVAAVTPASGADLTAVKRCRYVEARGARLFFAGDPTNPNTMYYSETGDPTNIKAASKIGAVTNDGDAIVGMEEFHNMLLVIKKGSIYAWSGYDPTFATGDTSFDRLNVPAGAVNNAVIARTTNEIFFYGMDGVYALRGTYPEVIEAKKISKDIAQTVGAITNPSLSRAVFHDGKYMLAVCTTAGGTQNDKLLVFFYDIWLDNLTKREGAEPWVIWDGVKPGALFKDFDGRLYVGAADLGRIYKYGGALTDNGAKINFELQTRPLNQGSVLLQKKYKYVYFALRQFDAAITDLTVKFRVDAVNGETPVVVQVPAEIAANDNFVWGVSKWGTARWGTSSLAARRCSVGMKGKRIFISVSNTTANQPLSLYGIGVSCKYKKPGRW